LVSIQLLEIDEINEAKFKYLIRYIINDGNGCFNYSGAFSVLKKNKDKFIGAKVQRKVQIMEKIKNTRRVQTLFMISSFFSRCMIRGNDVYEV
jgi:hypothetical protein